MEGGGGLLDCMESPTEWCRTTTWLGGGDGGLTEKKEKGYISI